MLPNIIAWLLVVAVGFLVVDKYKECKGEFYEF